MNIKCEKYYDIEMRVITVGFSRAMNYEMEDTLCVRGILSEFVNTWPSLVLCKSVICMDSLLKYFVCKIYYCLMLTCILDLMCNLNVCNWLIVSVRSRR